MKRAARYAGLALAWLLLVAYFTYLRFPYGRLRPVIEQRLAALGIGQIAFDEIGATPLGGVRLGGVSWTAPGAPASQAVAIDRLDLAPAYTKLVRRASGVSFDARLAGGSAHGTAALTAEGHRQIAARFDGIDLAKAKIPGLGVGLQGSIGGKVDVDLAGGPAEGGNGSFHLEALDGTVPPGVSPALAILPAPIRFAKLGVDATLDGSKLEITELALAGPDLEGAATGTITLRGRSIANGQLNADVKFKLPDGSGLKAAEMLLAGARMKKDNEGFYGLKLAGTVSSPVPRI